MGGVCLEYGMMHGAVIPRFPPLGQQVKSLDDGQGLTTVNPLSDLRPTRVVTTLPLRSSCLVKCHAQKKHEQNALHPAPQYPTVLACSSLHSFQCPKLVMRQSKNTTQEEVLLLDPNCPILSSSPCPRA